MEGAVSILGSAQAGVFAQAGVSGLFLKVSLRKRFTPKKLAGKRRGGNLPV